MHKKQTSKTRKKKKHQSINNHTTQQQVARAVVGERELSAEQKLKLAMTAVLTVAETEERKAKGLAGLEPQSAGRGKPKLRRRSEWW